jgi:hypothetical protein
MAEDGTRTLVLCVCYTDYDYPFGIFKLFLATFVYLSFGFLAPKDFNIILGRHLLTLIIPDED